jgi:ABC-type branched-subunit amino acid transport system substrate-binding protein
MKTPESRPRSSWCKTAALIVSVVPVVAGLTACGSSKSDTAATANKAAAATSGPSPSEATGTAPTGTPVKVGVIVEEKGVGLNWPWQESIDRAAVLGINRRGGINGHPLQLVSCDGQNDPNTELQCARQLVSEGVVADVGGITSTNGAAVDAYLEQHNIAQIGVNPLVDADFNSANQFLVNSGQLGIFSGDAANAAKQGLKKIWVMTLDVPGADLGIKVTKDAATAAGIRVVGSSKVPVTSTDDSSYVQAALAGGADAILPAMGPTQTAALLLAINQAGQKIVLINLDTEPASDLKDACGSGGGPCTNSIGSSFALPATDSTNAGIKIFEEDMAAEVAKGDKTATPEAAYNDLALEGWLGLQALAKVAAPLPSITNKTVLAAFKTATNIDLWGVIPLWTPNKSLGIKGYSRISNSGVYFTTLHSDLLPYAVDQKAYDVLQLDPALGG